MFMFKNKTMIFNLDKMIQNQMVFNVCFNCTNLIVSVTKEKIDIKIFAERVLFRCGSISSSEAWLSFRSICEIL